MWKIDTVNKKDANNAVFVLILVLINKYKVKIAPTLKINGKVLNHSIVFGTNDCHNLETKAIKFKAKGKKIYVYKEGNNNDD